MSAKPGTPITRKEMYLDVMTGGSSSLPEPITLEEMYLAKIAGMAVDLPTPRYIKHKYLAKIAGMTVNVPTYTTNLPRIYAYLAKAAGQDVEIPQPVTREEMYWFDYCGGTPTPPEREYTGAVPVTFTADGTPLLDLLISGNEEHSGTPTPDNPIMPQGTGERTGNLWNEDYTGISSSIKYVPVFVGEGTFTLSTDTPDYLRNAPLFLLSGNVTSGASTPVNGVYNGISRTTDSSNGYITIAFRWQRELSDPTTHKTMLNLGSTALPYEPYGVKIPILSANTTTPVYLGEVQTTRKIKKLVLTGEENIEVKLGNAKWYIPIADMKTPTNTSVVEWYCSHYQAVANSASWTSYDYMISWSTADSGTSIGLRIRDIDFLTGVTVADFKAYLAAQYAAGTPVTVWYVLATEEIGIVNEPIRKIGDYADTLSKEQAGVEIPTVRGTNTLDVLTDVKPSEVYIKYRGEAVATLSALPAEVSSPETTPEEENPEETEETENGSENISLQHKPEAVE